MNGAEPMKVITINLPPLFLDQIDLFSSNRSEYIRNALEHFLDDELDFLNILKKEGK